MKNLTIALDDETYRRVRIRAAELDTSVSAMVKEYLTGLTSRETEFERLEKLEQEITKRITDFRASDILSRDELYDRKLR